MTPGDCATPDRELQARLGAVLAERDQLEMLLRERERDRKEFFATLAHEMRNPLAAMRSAIHVLRVVAQERVELARARVNLRVLMQRGIESNRALLESRQQHLKLDLPSDPVWLYVDSRRMVQVFASIINNASKFSGAGTDINIRAEREAHQLIVTITDEGVGIREDILPQVTCSRAMATTTATVRSDWASA